MKSKALDWDKVVEVVSNGISINDVAIIQRCENRTKVSEYKNLVEFLFRMLGPIQINKVKYICFWKDATTALVKSTAKKVGGSATEIATTADDATGGCLGAIVGRVLGIVIFMFIIFVLASIADAC